MNKVRATYKRLDYNNGDFLAHYQWRIMQDSVMFVWSVLQDDEDGMYTRDQLNLIFKDLNILSKKYGMEDNYFIIAHLTKVEIGVTHKNLQWTFNDGLFTSYILPVKKEKGILTIVAYSLNDEDNELNTGLTVYGQDDSNDNKTIYEFEDSDIINDIMNNATSENYVTVWGKEGGKLTKLNSCDNVKVSNLNIYQNLQDVYSKYGNYSMTYKDDEDFVNLQMSFNYDAIYTVNQSMHSMNGGNDLPSTPLDVYTADIMKALMYCDVQCTSNGNDKVADALKSLRDISNDSKLDDNTIKEVCTLISLLCDEALSQLYDSEVTSLYKSLVMRLIDIESTIDLLEFEMENNGGLINNTPNILAAPQYNQVKGKLLSCREFDKQIKDGMNHLSSLFKIDPFTITLEEMNDYNNIELLELGSYMSSLKGNKETYMLGQYEAACLAKFIYSETDKTLLGDWKEAISDEKKLKEMGVDIGKKDIVSGYRSSLYKKTYNDKDYYCFVTCGTNMQDFTYDWPTNFSQGTTGVDSEQYLKTIKNALIIDEYLKDMPLCFVGHSLGGGLATVNAIATGRCAVTFNPAGIKQSTLDRVNVKDPESQVKNYVIRGEILNEYINNKPGDGYDWGSYFGKIIYVEPKCDGGSSIEKHDMCHFLKYQCSECEQ